MNAKIEKLLKNQGGNYIFPFLWLHGEEEEILRDYMRAIDENNIKAVCVESRPHPDYCGPKWWEDMDIIVEEARKRSMKVWILDDSHFPTGFANGAMAEQPDERCRQSICCRIYDCTGLKELHIARECILHPDAFQPSQLEMHIGEKYNRRFDDDRLLGLFAVRRDIDNRRFSEAACQIDLMAHIKDGELNWDVPEGEWKVYTLHLSRNMGYHRNYINMMDRASCRILIDAVYEPHYEHYKGEFGKTIAGFFSDEPELGNGHMYENGILFGTAADFPWSEELEERLRDVLGREYITKLALLWEEDADHKEKARVRYAYMDAVTSLVETNFSRQLGDWCRAHGVQYIGHLIEDNNQHARTGSSLGHYYRGLAGQDMAGIDDIGGQVLPQGEDLNLNNGPFSTRVGEFYHYMLGKLGSSAAAIEPLKQGNSMCEIFGAYGWSEGLRLEKYLLDHFLVRGINHYVPHAYSAKEYPDPDCPPHFYANGNNPQHRHFGRLMAYANRVCELISGGRHVAPVAVLYHGEGEWTGTCMFSHKVGHLLADAQIDYDYIPQDVFADPAGFKTITAQGMLKVNTQEYKAVIVPAMQYVTEAFAAYVHELLQAGIPVFFVEAYPEGICNAASNSEAAGLIGNIKKAQLVKQEDIITALQGCNDITVIPANNRIRYYHYEHTDGSGLYLLVNEGTKSYQGKLMIKDNRSCYLYHAWDNYLEETDYDGTFLSVNIAPLKSLIVVLDGGVLDQTEISAYIRPAVRITGDRIALKGDWKRSFCKSIEYPNFKNGKTVSLPDRLEVEEPDFSGFVRYENIVVLPEFKKVILEITDAHEGVEVFVNGESQGIQIVPPYLYDLAQAAKAGENEIVIEVATTLEREMAKQPNMFGQMTEPSALSGITGSVGVYIS